MFVYPDVQLANEEWYLESGEKGEAETSHFGSIFIEADGSWHKMSEQSEFEILENDGERITAIIKPLWTDRVVICMAQQMGEDLVLACSDGVGRITDDHGTSKDKALSPDMDLDDRAFLLEPLTALFDGRIRLLQGLSKEQMTQILPDRIADYPVGFSLNKKHFSIPCSELLSVGMEDLPWLDDYYAPAIRFKGSGPDGKGYVYSLYNGGETHKNNAVGYVEPLSYDLNRAYRDEEAAVDSVMSDFIGAKAVEYQDGWLILVGNIDPNGKEKQLYFLTMEQQD